MRRPERMWLVVALAVSGGLTGELRAQGGTGGLLEAGARVRFRLREGQECGKPGLGAGNPGVATVTAVTSTDMTVLPEAYAAQPEEWVVVPRDSVCTVEVSRGMGRNSGRGALVGAGVGLALGAGLTGLCLSGAAEQDIANSDCVLVGSGAFVLGALTGLGIGALTRSERWVEVRPEQAAPGPAGGDGGMTR
jgi:hypothetical protein